ncbi:putative glutamine ABC transporter permease protein GlnM [Pseudovibrio axinellae]|uniref:Putative glutamine ABC transporter permease protein GlnM n=1 Tax=Pseudovibrio axinellae TaxID=989403 RepID=A0A166B0L9_9HYPH|nr:ABC transporter permease subunit [Pseudovibrio axinellae]KZL21790.1 putative glutamine ABC transporter permease protein GlnM [Pseudovibrio axinellae]SEQ78668.1 L-glutamine ABC transporter membrane protein /L-glutamate ABC transporter membrane protein /L-aspartate ABC transporter membrane protein /L-asparagine ABC transporter membrane protein [Pseudovibrio axinellae]
MSASTVPADNSFQFSQLWRDARYRSYTIQIIALVVVLSVVMMLISNAVENLEALGKDFNFGFLSEPAGYDIGQMLVEYSAASAHWKAALVGLLNTLLVALLACVSATVLGVFAGILRLSNNWVVSRLMAVYIEGVRNVPLLLQILAWYAVFIHVLPTPKQALKAPVIEGAVYATNRGFYVPGLTLSNGYLFVVGALLASVAGIFVFRKWARKRQEETGQILPLGLISLGLLIVPAALVYFAVGMPIALDYPIAGRFNLQGGLKVGTPLIALWFALSIYSGAFIAEIVRAGIMAISKGQSEAASALGLRPNRTMSLVVLPQALRIIIPPMISNYLNITKNSSLAIAVGYMDLTGTLGGITLNQTGREMECMLLLMATYLVISLSISGVMNAYNESVKLKGR